MSKAGHQNSLTLIELDFIKSDLSINEKKKNYLNRKVKIMSQPLTTLINVNLERILPDKHFDVFVSMYILYILQFTLAYTRL